MATYRPRILDVELDALFTELPAIALHGPKGVGKTTTAKRRATTVLSLDDDEQRRIVSAAPQRIATLPTPVLLDEWQRLPGVWDRVRRAVDDDPTPGRFLLTGSAAPAHAPVHSGAGRIVDLRMRPLSLAERDLGPTTVSLAELLTGTRPAVEGRTEVDLAGYVEEILRSGLPAVREYSARARRAQLDAYLRAVVTHELTDAEVVVRRPAALMAWLTAYAAATSTTASYETILAAATPAEGSKPTKVTAMGYREVLTQLWLLDPVPSWVPSRRPLARLGQAPKHQLADPALAARLLGATTQSLLAGDAPGPRVPRDGPLLGSLFEHLVTMSVQVYAQAAEARVHHLRTHRGEHEIDIIVVRDDGRVLAIEVKLTAAPDDGDVRHLHWLTERIGSDLIDTVVITTGREAYRREDGIAVVPAALLGA
jgi:predicted AAA+ superfamily ATPase